MVETHKLLARLKAREILTKLDIKFPSEIAVEEIAWTRNALVQKGPLEGAEGRLVCGDKGGIITVKADIPETGKKRFVAAHELGHFELHKVSNKLVLCTDKDLLYWHKTIKWHESIKPQEREANEFAAELLMPENLFGPRCRTKEPSLDVIKELADEFQTSLTATALRYIEFCPHRCATVFSKDKTIKWYQATEDFGYHLAVREKLHPNSVAIYFFNGKEMPTTMQPVWATSWLSGERFRSDSVIQEHSVSLPRYNSVLTLLWIDEDIDDFSLDEEEESEYDLDYFTPDGKRWRW